MKKPKNIPTYYESNGTPIYRDTTALPFLDGGPLVDKTDHGKLLNSVYASALGNYYAQGGMIKRADGSYSPRGLWDNIRANKGSGKEPTEEMLAQERKINREYRTGGQFPRPYSLPEDSFKQGGENLHNSVYASSPAQYPAVYKYGGSFEMPRQQMYMPLDNVERYGGPQQNARFFSTDGEKHKVYLKTSPTGMGEGVQGHIMVNHPTEDKGQWDTIDLTDKAGAKTVAQGVAATKQWHEEHPNQYRSGGVIKTSELFRNGGSILSMSNTPQLEGEGKDLTYPDGAYVYAYGGNLFADGGPIYPTNQQLAQFLNPEYQRVTQGKEITVKPTPYQLQQANNKTEKYNALNIKPEVAESTKPNIAPIDKNIKEKAIAQKAAERKIVAEEIKNSPMLTKEQKTEILMDPQKLDENVHLAYQKEAAPLKTGKEYTTADKAINILRNPLVAASYFMKPGAFNMPMNYSELERSPNYSDETWNRNAVGQGINFASYLNPVGLALHTIDNALYTASDLDKALESGKIEDWKQAGLSAANTGLDLIGSRYIGNSGRLLSTAEQATLNAMNASNRLGLNSGVNNYLGTRVFPNISSQAVRSADNLPITRLFPQINPNAVNYNPLSRNLYNQAVTAGNTQNVYQAASESLPIAPRNNALNTIKNTFLEHNPLVNQTIGSIKNKGRQEQLREAENWMKDWVQHPATQEKILNSYKKALEGKNLNATEKHNLEEMIKFSSGYDPTNRLGEYPLLRQGLWKNNIHSNNFGVSYTHEELPGQILNPAENTYIDPRVEIKPLDNDVINSVVQNDPRYGNWISRTLSPEKRISTGIHELGHDWIKDYTLKNTELGNMLKNSVDEFKVQEILDKYAGTSLENKAKEEIEYLTDPTEIYSRLFEARRHFDLKPGQVITKNQADDYLAAIAAGSTPITPVFGKLIARGKKAADLFNNPWAWTGIAAGTALSNQKKQGGVIKTSDLFR